MKGPALVINVTCPFAKFSPVPVNEDLEKLVFFFHRILHAKKKFNLNCNIYNTKKQQGRGTAWAHSECNKQRHFSKSKANI